ncbi:MAG: CHAT domain-containing tetratricopeptide repeat protein [Cyanobacteria bacterium P01_D01_bin.115]
MALKKKLTGSLISLVLAIGSPPFFATPIALASLEQIAQIAPNSITGKLDSNSGVLDDGSYFNVHEIEGQAGEAIRVELSSEAFDAYIVIVGPDGKVLAHADDFGDSTNAVLALNLPQTGSYKIFANSYGPEESGQYILAWRFVDNVQVDAPEELITPPEVSQSLQNFLREPELAASSVTAQLDENSQVDSGRYFNVHTFEGVAGETVLINLQSNDFEPYVGLAGSDGNVIAQNGNWRGRQTSQIITTLPYDGTYQIVATHYLSDEQAYRIRQTGEYQLVWRSATEEDIAQAVAHEEAISRARILRRQAFKLSADEFCCDEALFIAEEALEIYREQLGEDHPDVADNLLNVGGIYAQQLRFDEAEILLLEAVQIYRESLVDQYFLLTRALNKLAILYESWGRFSEAEELYIESLEINQGGQGLDEQYLSYVPSALSNLGGLYVAQGRYSEAERLHLEALEMRRERFGEGSSAVGLSLGWLAYLYMFQGRYDEAEPLFLEVLEINREQQARRNEIAIDLNNLARLYYAQGRYNEAEPLFREAIEMYREILELREGNILLNLATSLRSLGTLYISEGRFDEAEALFLEAQEIYQRNPELGEFYIDNAPNLDGLAAIYQSWGDYAKAELLIKQAMTIYSQQLGDNHPNIASSLNRLSILHQAKGNFDQAISLFDEGLEIEELHLNVNLASLADGQRQAYAATIADSTNRVISLDLQSNTNSSRATRLALTTLLRRKGRILEAGSSGIERLRQNLTDEEKSLLNTLSSVRQQLAALIFNPPDNLPLEQYRTLLSQLEVDENELSSNLARRSAAFRADEVEAFQAESVQAQIPADGVLVEYARYRTFDAVAGDFGAPRYAVYLLFPDGRIEAVDLGDATEIDAAVQSFVGLLQTRSAEFQRGPGAPPTIREADVEQITGDIKALVFDPIAPYLQDTDHLLISPDGQLNLLPFEALQAEAGGDYLVQQYQISYLNSGRDLLKFDVVEPSDNQAVIVANPDYEVADDTVVAQGRSTGDNRRSTELSQLQVGPLPGTAAEAEAIRPLLPNADIRIEDEATENLIKSVESPRILHIATHGFFLPNVERPEVDSSLALASSNPFGSVAAPGVAVENPLLRSGLALAGFNTRSSGSEDGVLTALEASQLNLFGTQLVVLSACDTGLGDITNGEGVYGLRRAFAIAGAESQMLSLWQVSDFGTQSLMARYYENLTAGMGRSEALREVQLEMIEEGGEYSHPYYWAAFILAGDWRPLE